MILTPDPAIHTVSDSEAMANVAAELFVEHVTAAIIERGRALVSLAGGSTPVPVYELLGSDNWRDRVDWRRIHLLWGDERCVPPDHPESNYGKVRKELIDQVPIPPEQVHRIHGEDAPEDEAVRYEQELRGLADEQYDTPRLRIDLMFLGMGDDGHTASIFPGSSILREQNRWVSATYVEHLRAWRVTMTPVLINASRQVVLLVRGQNKAKVVHTVVDGPSSIESHPVSVVRPSDGHVLWLLDDAAAAEIASRPPV